MERTEIIITTEKVKLSEMNEREKTIYETGFNDGLEAANDAKWARIFGGVFILAVLAMFTWFSMGSF